MKQIIKEFLVSALLFFSILLLTLQVDWMKTFQGVGPDLYGTSRGEE